MNEWSDGGLKTFCENKKTFFLINGLLRVCLEGQMKKVEIKLTNLLLRKVFEREIF
jgi:hypothetical protein